MEGWLLTTNVHLAAALPRFGLVGKAEIPKPKLQDGRPVGQHSPWLYLAAYAPGELRKRYPERKKLADVFMREGSFTETMRANAGVIGKGFRALLHGHNPITASVEAYLASRTLMESPAFPPRAQIDVPALKLVSDRKDYDKLFDFMHNAWPQLVKEFHGPVKNSLLPLPNPYVVPGGVFKEMYYWDSFFIMQGLKISRLDNLLDGMVDNMLHLSEEYGIIPNGNRSYYLTRSQPPLLTGMIAMAAPHKDRAWLEHAYGVAKKEYQNVWMNPETRFVQEGEWNRRGQISRTSGLNRYYDPNNHKMPENDKEKPLGLDPTSILTSKDLRAECESGWDFTNRFDHRCTDFLPIDLNSLLYKYEKDMAGFAEQLGRPEEAADWKLRAEERKQLVNQYMWDEKRGMFMDYDFKNKKRSEYETLASYFPLWTGLATPEQGRRSVENLKKFEADGGLMTSMQETGEQWDAPNGWPNLNLVAMQAAKPYDPEMSKRLAHKWLDMVSKVQQETGTVYEKYNVKTCSYNTSGHYPAQGLFGWTIGSSMAMLTDILGYQVTEGRPAFSTAPVSPAGKPKPFALPKKHAKSGPLAG